MDTRVKPRMTSKKMERNHLQAPAQAAIGAGFGRPVGFERATEGAIGRPSPDLAQRFLRGIAERVILVAMLRERRDAARQRAAIGREIHQGPRPPAQRPGRALVAALKADARLRGTTGRAKRDAEFLRQRGRAFNIDGLLGGEPLVECLIRAMRPRVGVNVVDW